MNIENNNMSKSDKISRIILIIIVICLSVGGIRLWYKEYKENKEYNTYVLRYNLNTDGNSYSVEGRENSKSKLKGKIVNIPDKYKDKPVTSIENYAFKGFSNLTGITIPDSVTSIGYNAFSGCSNLTSITIPDSVTNIGNAAFEDCSKLTSVTISDKVTSIGDDAFKDCGKLEKVIWNAEYCTKAGSYGNSITKDYTIFKGCSKLTEVVFGNNVGTIPDFAFYGCSGLTSVTIPDSVISIRDNAFSGCSGLTSVTLESITVDKNNTSYVSKNRIVSNGIINKDEALSIKKTIERAMENVFLIYGRNEKLNRKIKSAIENAGFNVLSLNKQCVKGGESLLQAVKRQAKKCTMAVAVCSADDQVVFDGELYRQARPNVYFEIGYLYGLYGEYRVLIVKQEECRNPSDLAVMYIQENNLNQLTNSLLEISKL